MKTKVQTMISFLKCHTYAVVALAVLLAVAAIWVAPLRTSLTFLRFETPGVADQTPLAVEVYSEKAYHKTYRVDATVANGRFEILLAKNFLPADRIVITDASVAQAVTLLEVRQSLLKDSDHVCTSVDNGVMVKNAEGAFELSDAALMAAQRGASDTRMLRLLFTAVAVGIGALAVLFLAVHRRFGNIKAIFIVGMPIGCAVLLAKALENGIYSIAIFQWHVPVLIPVAAIMAVVAMIIAACILIPSNSVWVKRLVVAVYVLAFVFSAAKMLFYSERVGRAPDEAAHIAYVAQLHQSGDILPHYEDLRLGTVDGKNGHVWQFSLPENSTNYLGHPPLYYHVMRLVGGITFTSDSTFTADVFRLRLLSMAMTLIGLGLMFYIGYTRIKASALVHLLYATVTISVPMFAYGAAGVNNDALTYITVPLFFLEILRYLEQKRTLSTYLLIAIGISATVLTKLTAGLMVAVAGVIVLAVSLIRQKSARELLKPAFLWTLVIYAIPLVYYLAMYAQYGHFRPSFFELNPDYAYASIFYEHPANRTTFSALEYFCHFFMNFMRCWTGVVSHVSLIKPSPSWVSLQNIALVLIWFSPWLFAKRSLRRKSPYSVAVIAAAFGVAVAVVMQFLNGCTGFLMRGHTGGYQSRYYVCMVFIFAFCMALALHKLLESLQGSGRNTVWLRHLFECVTAIYIGLLFYEDFLFFLLHFRQYLVG